MRHSYEAMALCVLKNAALIPLHRLQLRFFCFYPRISGSLCTGGEL